MNVMLNLTIFTLADYLTYYSALMGGYWLISYLWFSKGANENGFHFCFLHKYGKL